MKGQRSVARQSRRVRERLPVGGRLPLAFCRSDASRVLSLDEVQSARASGTERLAARRVVGMKAEEICSGGWEAALLGGMVSSAEVSDLLRFSICFCDLSLTTSSSAAWRFLVADTTGRESRTSDFRLPCLGIEAGRSNPELAEDDLVLAEFDKVSDTSGPEGDSLSLSGRAFDVSSVGYTSGCSCNKELLLSGLCSAPESLEMR